MDRRLLVTVGIGLVLAGCAAMHVTASPHVIVCSVVQH
jgi:hypothetical protein